MLIGKRNVVALLLVAACMAWLPARTARAEGEKEARNVHREYAIILLTPHPVPEEQVTARIVIQKNLPPEAYMQWGLYAHEDSFHSAGTGKGNQLEFCFVPKVPGDYTVCAEFYDKEEKLLDFADLRVQVSDEPSPQGASAQQTGGAQSALPEKLSMNLLSGQPQAGKPVTLTVQAEGGLPKDCQVHWIYSGGAVDDLTTEGGNNEVFSFTPQSAGSYAVMAVVRVHFSLAEVRSSIAVAP